MIQKELQQLLQEIYKTNPNLKKNEDKIIDILNDLGALKPEAILSDKLKQQIKQEILNKVGTNDLNQIYQKQYKNKTSLLNRFAYAVAGMAIAFAILVPLFQIKNNSHIKQTLVATTIQQVEKEAFFSEDFENQQVMSISNTQDGLPSTSEDNFSINSRSLEAMPIQDYAPIKYKYTFDGKLPPLENEMNIYKILENKDIFNDISRNIKTKGLDLQKFKNLKINDLSFIQDQKDGYHIYIDNKGNININKNNEFYSEGKDKLNNKLDKTLAINNSNKFIKEFKLNLSQYGDPIITDNNIDTMYAMNGQENYGDESYETSFYPSNKINILYPYLIDKYLVYDQYSTNLYGIQFELDPSSYDISSIYNLQNHTLKASKYILETNIDYLLNQVKNIPEIEVEFDFSTPNQQANQTQKEIEIKLINPKIQYMKYYIYKDNQSHEFFVPVLVFGQQNNKSETKENYEFGSENNQKIIVPIIKNFNKIFENEKIDPIAYR